MNALERYDAETIARAKSHLEECKTAPHDKWPYMLGGCEEIIRQLLRILERGKEKP